MNLLTGKCKELFEDWYSNRDELSNEYLHTTLCLHVFYELPLSMQFGVIQDFAESIGIVIDVQPILDYEQGMYCKVVNYDISVVKLGSNLLKSGGEDTLNEARTQAIKKFNEIVNESNHGAKEDSNT